MASEPGRERELFEIPDDVAYFNVANLGPQLHSVRATAEAALDQRGAPWTIGESDWFTQVERRRELFAEVMDADVEGTALVPTTSYGMAIAAANLEAGPGDRVLALDKEYPSGVYTWRAFAERTGAELVTVHPEGGQAWADAILDALDERVRIVSMPNVHWINGALVDLAPVCDRARELGAAIVLDLSQSAGAMAIDIERLRPDFIVSVGYKWLFGPLSLGYLWVDPRHRQGRPIEHNWIVRRGAQDFARLIEYTDELEPGARRFDVGGRTNLILTPMAIAALEQILEWSVPHIERSLTTVTAAIEERARGRGLKPLAAADRGPHMIGLELPEPVPEGISAGLAARNVYASVRGSWLRIAPHLHTTEADVDRLFSALDAALPR